MQMRQEAQIPGKPRKRTLLRPTVDGFDLQVVAPTSLYHQATSHLRALIVEGDLVPSKRDGPVSSEERKLVRDTVIQCWYALRETFLEELDLEEPEQPILIWGAVRSKEASATSAARRRQQQQEHWQRRLPGRRPEIDRLLEEAWEREHKRRE